MLPRPLTRPTGVSSAAVELPTRGTPTLAVEYVLAADPVGTVLLSHGYTGSKEDFWAVLPLLAARGLSAYAFDKRGQHQSRSDGPFTLDDYAADTAALSRALPGQRPDLLVHLLGHSWGGLEVARSVILHPDAYASVTLFCTGPAGHGPRPFNEPWLSALRTSSAADCWDQLAVRNAARGIPPAPRPEQAFLRARFLAGNPRSLAAMTEIDLTLPDQIDALRETGVQALVVRGEDDRAWDPELQDDMARRLGTSVLVVPGGHTPNTDAPTEFVDAWLNRLLPPRTDRGPSVTGPVAGRPDGPLPEDLRRRLGAAFAAGGSRYDELRPGYPDAAVDWLVRGTPAGGRVADLGAGTGKLTGALADRGFDVVAIDPSADMLSALRDRLPAVDTRLGTGEATGLEPASVDLATFAQSWHWVDPATGTAELHRILRPGGAVAMVWNFLDVRVDWVAELAEIWHTLATRESIDATRHVPTLGTGFGAVESSTVDWEHTTTLDALAGLVTTRSYYLTASAPEQQQIRDRAAGFLVDRFGGRQTVALPYRCHCYRVARTG